MKKNTLVRLLALAPCVAVLSGCGGEQKLVVKLPESFHIGDVIDLDKYVKVSNTRKSTDYTVLIYSDSKDLVSLKDHKLTIKEEGEVTFHVRHKDEKVVCTVPSIYETRERLIKTFAKYTGSYNIYGEGQYNIGDFYAHGPEYGVRRRYTPEENYVWNGIISPEGHEGAYLFNMDSSYNLEYEGQVFERSSGMKTYNGPIDVDFQDLDRKVETIEGEDVEFYTLKGSALNAFAKNALCAPDGKYTYYLPVDGNGNYSASSTTYAEFTNDLSKAEFCTVNTAKDGEKAKYEPFVLLYAPVKTKIVNVGVLYFTNESFASDSLTDELVEIFDRTKPGSRLTLAPYFTSVIPAYKSFIATFKTGWVNSRGNDIPIPSDAKGTILEDLPIDSSTRVFKENAIVNIVENNVVSGMVQKDGVCYDVRSNGTAHSKAENPDFADIYEDPYLSMSFVGNAEYWPSDMIYIASKKNQGTTEDPSYLYTYGFTLDRFYGIIDAFGICDESLWELVSFLFKYETRDVKSWFDASMTFNPTTNVFSISFTLVWDSSAKYQTTISIEPDTEGTYDETISNLMAELFN